MTDRRLQDHPDYAQRRRDAAQRMVDHYLNNKGARRVVRGILGLPSKSPESSS